MPSTNQADDSLARATETQAAPISLLSARFVFAVVKESIRETLESFIGKNVNITFTNGTAITEKLLDVMETHDSFKLAVDWGEIDYEKIDTIGLASSPEPERPRRRVHLRTALNVQHRSPDPFRGLDGRQLLAVLEHIETLRTQESKNK
jgi:hypothetical protein